MSARKDTTRVRRAAGQRDTARAVYRDALVITLELSGELRAWVESSGRPPAEVVRQHLEADLRRTIYACAESDEHRVRTRLARCERLAAKEVLKNWPPDQSAEALARAQLDAQECARRTLERKLATALDPVLRAAYERVQFEQQARGIIGPEARNLKQEFRRLRLARPGGWRSAPSEDPNSRPRPARAKGSRRVA